MSRRTIFYIIAAAILFHVGLFYLASHTRALPKVRQVPRPNFIGNEMVYEDSTTGEKIVYREYKVSTKLADPAMIQRMEEQIAKSKVAPK
ncbi:MAG TPA: hypothetical protein VGO11_17270 [Chthoniobacteraceae bacterium]|jgi:hypothetical protein|nr:hypothetical protein [Chthoniobacteraceae bacterium]